MGVPPLQWINEFSLDHNREMQVIASGHTGGAGVAENSAFSNLLTFFNLNLTQVTIEAKQPPAVIQNDRLSINTQGPVKTTMPLWPPAPRHVPEKPDAALDDLSIYLPTFIHITAMIGEGSHRFAVRQP